MEVRMYSSTCCCRSVSPCMDGSLLNMCARVKQRVFLAGSAGSDFPELVEDLPFEGVGMTGLAAVIFVVGPLELVFVVRAHEGRERFLVGAHEQLLFSLVTGVA